MTGQAVDRDAELDVEPRQWDGFVSYKREERDAVEAILGPIARPPHNRTFWIDHDDIEPGTNWRDRIDTGIAASSAFLYMISSASLKSLECRSELGTAVRFGKRVIPVRLERDLGPAAVPDEVAAQQWIDATDPATDTTAEIVEAIDLDIEWVDRHSWLLAQALDWSGSGRGRGGLLHGDRLTAAEDMVARASDDVRPRIVQLQVDLVTASASARSRRRWTWTVIALAVAIIAGLAVVASIQRSRAEDAERVAASLRQASDSSVLLGDQLDLGILTALTGVDTDDSIRTRSALVNALTNGRGVRSIERLGFPLNGGAIGATGEIAVVIAASSEASVRSLGESSSETLGRADTAAITPDGRSVVVAGGGTARHHTGTEETEPCPLAGDAVESAISADVAAVATRVDGTSNVYLFGEGCPSEPSLTTDLFVTALAFDAVGETLAIGTSAGELILWSVGLEGRLEPRLPADDAVSALAISDDARLVAAGLGGGRIAVWDVVDAQAAPRTFEGVGTEIVNAVDFSSDGSTLIEGDGAGFVQVFDVATGSPTGPPMINHPEDRQQSVVLDVDFGPDDARALSVHGDGRILQWVVVDRSPLWSRLDVDGAAEDLARADGELLTATSAGVWSTPISSDGGSSIVWPQSASAVAVDRSTGRLLVGTPEGDVVIVDESGETGALPGHDGTVNAVAWAAGGTVAVSAGRDGLVLITELTAGTTVEAGHDEGYVADLAASPDGTWVASVGFDRTVRRWSVPDGTLLATLTGHTGSVDSVAVHPDGDRLASGSDDRSIIVWDVETGSVLDRLTAHADRVVSLAYSDDGSRLVSGSEDRTVILWDLAESLVVGQPLADEFRTQASAVMFHPRSLDRFSVASAGLSTWDLAPDRLESEACAIAAGRTVTDAEQQRYFAGLEPFAC